MIVLLWILMVLYFAAICINLFTDTHPIERIAAVVVGGATLYALVSYFLVLWRA